ncbi:MAG: hypothetical protein ACP5HZ_04665 [Ferrimicrobium sp.]|uniref:hypothetical protein n=1 Tax=Ferrimicrobium sp. TaxID=2926050 RepID=UPI002615D8EA|nr:hypothetical protein [Ferrimicrobium sp.]
MKILYVIARILAWLIGLGLLFLAVAAIRGGAAQLGSLMILVVVLIGLLVLGGRRQRFRNR